MISVLEGQCGYLPFLSASEPGSWSFSSITPSDQLAISSGNGQTAPPGQTLKTPLTISVVDKNGNPAANVPISFSYQQPSGAIGTSLSATSAVTDHNGLASTQITLGDILGDYQVTAFCSGGTCTSSVTFVETVSCHVNRCSHDVTDNCVQQFAGPPSSSDGHKTSMNAFFTPWQGLTVKEEADACRFKGYEWQQEITNLPCPSPFESTSTSLSPDNFCKNIRPPKLTASPSFPFPDPPQKGYSFPTIYDEYDPWPFYYLKDLVIKEESNPSPFCITGAFTSLKACIVLVTLDGKRLSFFDDPANPCLPGATAANNQMWCGGITAPADNTAFIGFTTRLVGITQDNLASPPLYEWTWMDTYNQTTGGIPATSFPPPAPFVDPGGTGGVTITSISGVEQTPPSTTCTATPNTLWPPNGNSVVVTVSGNVSAGTSPIVSGAYAVTDEYGRVQPSGNIVIGSGGIYSFGVSLTASRGGSDADGRTYTIVVSGTDQIGNVGSCSAVVTVPHDQGT